MRRTASEAEAAGAASSRLRRWGPGALALLVAAGALTALRVDLIRVRYELQSVQQREALLAAQHSELTVALRRLRDPVRLGERARELGFGPPEQVVALSPTPAAPPEDALAEERHAPAASDAQLAALP